YRFTDPEDKLPYLYSDFEPYDANGFIPCFDQPDLKAVYSSTVTAPKDWSIISSVRESGIVDSGANKVWTFPLTKKFSTYIYSLHAGPYKMWTSEVKTKTHTLPLRLFARQSLAKYVDTEEWFSTTRQGFQFFEDYFAYAYPYEKYDQVIVPDFNSGAMENVGAVTFNEQRFVSRGPKSRIQKRSLAEVILHEMAHMWFGNLVTMKWWNDIWLNESFATFAAARALSEATPYKEAWIDFTVDAKGSAYWTDQLVTTHPIVFEVANTDVVFANFDGITYGKGASVLKQLMFYLGEDNFKKGLQDYFAKHAFSNTTLEDFIGALAQASNKDLKDWKKVWLEIAQVNTIKAEYQCTDGKVAFFQILQTADKEYPTLRPHRTKVALFDVEKNDLKTLKVADVTYMGEKTQVADFVGMNCDQIKFVYPNYEDFDYVKVEFDSTSLETIEKNISSFSDSIIKVGAWRSLWDMVVDGRLSGLDFMKTYYNHAHKEKNADVLRQIIGNAATIVGDAYPEAGAWKQKHVEEEIRYADYVLKAAKESPDSDVQRLWVTAFANAAVSPEQLAVLRGALDKTPEWFKFPLDQDHRWAIVGALTARNYPKYDELAVAESQKDSSARGEQMRIFANAAAPTPEAKEQWWGTITRGPSEQYPLGKLRYAIAGLFPYNQKALKIPYQEKFFESIKLMTDMPVEFLGPFTELAPDFCTTSSVNKLKDFASSESDELPTTVIKRLKIGAQQAERCVSMRGRMEASQAKDPS
ncbi:MAG: aminopeptidase N, partial [Bdellovibrionaceae bacterium]|nr:aminopeptidase N [Pseudobdellovibrionaceae bacterium]